MVKVGMEIKAGSMLLRVNESKFGWVRFEFWNPYYKEWKMRGYTEKRAVVEAKLKSGEWTVVEESERGE